MRVWVSSGLYCIRTVLEAPGLVAGLNDMAVVCKAVEQDRSHLGFAEHNRPFGNAQLGRDNHTGVFVELRGQVKQLCVPGPG